ncbi:MAG: hypothetical protein M3069_08825 [Chloroflexota bacterium]|nr:hypothetical protein [Chloroflexota bacterium]
MPVDTAALKQRIDLLALVGHDTRLRKVASTAGAAAGGAAANHTTAGQRCRTDPHPYGCTRYRDSARYIE